mmetsp:Transcript_39394/g.83941  ORF Transcript_39394/g.83941 Transcript_39394/m.83941 type:complete len:210 (-) Transcript_39394:41-670(-)
MRHQRWRHHRQGDGYAGAAFCRCDRRDVCQGRRGALCGVGDSVKAGTREKRRIRSAEDGRLVRGHGLVGWDGRAWPIVLPPSLTAHAACKWERRFQGKGAVTSCRIPRSGGATPECVCCTTNPQQPTLAIDRQIAAHDAIRDFWAIFGNACVAFVHWRNSVALDPNNRDDRPPYTCGPQRHSVSDELVLCNPARPLVVMLVSICHESCS